MSRLFPTLLVVLASAILASAQPRFAHESSDLRPDPAVRFGVLPNGLRYAVLANAEPRQRASLRLYVDVGSLHETEAQRGVAHFLEHMAFNGSRNYAPGTLIEFFQRMGMNFGGDTNASTGFDRTQYFLELPETKPETLAEGFRVLGDYAGGLLLQDREIDRERGVIQSEKRTRDSVDFRSFVAEFEFLLGDSRFPQRIPIGADEVIAGAPRSEFVSFYDTWYRPERMAVIAVGDFDAAAVEQQIVSTFSPIVGRAPAQPEPDLGTIAQFEGVRVKFHSEPEAAATTVGIQTLTPYTREPDTAANRIKYLPRSIAVGILNRRLAELAKKEGAPFSSGRASVAEGYDFYRNASIDLTCQPDQWAAALSVADQELRRALEHGFQPAELREVVAGYLNALEQGVRTASTRRSSGLAGELLDSIADQSVFTTPADDLALFRPALEKITVDDCLSALRDAWNVPHRYVTVFGNAKPGPDVAAAERAITDAYRQSLAVAVQPPAAIADTAFAYTDFGPAGTVTERRHVEDLDVTLVTFANGVRLNLKKTDFEADRIRMSVRIGAGQLLEPRNQPGLGLFAGNVFSAGGLGKHSADDLRRILAGRNVGTGLSVGADALNLGGATTPADLLLQLQLTTAFIVDPGYRPEAERQLRKGLEQLYTRLAHTPQGPLQLDFSRLLAGGDPRFGTPLEKEIAARTIEEARAWLTPQLATGAIEIALVGDLDLDAAIDAVGRTLGALPPRAPKPALEEARQVSLPATPLRRDYTVETEIPKGIVALYWPTTDAKDIHVVRRLSLLGEVFADRLRVKVREELGGAYSPGAGNTSSETYRGYGYMIANVTVDPERASEIADVVTAIAADLAANGVSEDELDRARQPILTSIRESSRTNQYWLGSVLASAQEFPERLDYSRSRTADFEGITKAEVDALAKAYLGSDRASRAGVLPVPAAAK
ncbi:MAG TPA: insulinase family protein [Opitutaceae bacterium]